MLWSPQPGRHKLGLVDASGRELDSVSFEVCGIFSRKNVSGVESTPQTQ